jgi:lipopolysaccharide transport system permease protein
MSKTLQTGTATEMPLITIEAGKSERHYWNDIWRYRELFYFLAWRDVLVRYKQTTIGIIWAVLRPLMTMAVFTLVFGKVAKLPSDGVPYALLVFTGLLPWHFFASAFTEAANSLIENEKMITKVYFPRLIIPTSAVIASVLELIISGGLLFALMMVYGMTPDWRIVALPFFAVLAFAAAVGAGVWVAALNVRYRDFRYVIPFMVQAGLYISPVGFSSRLFPDEWRLLFYLNPITGVIDGFRWALLSGKPELYESGLLVSGAVTVMLVIIGIFHFRKTEKTFADVI